MLYRTSNWSAAYGANGAKLISRGLECDRSRFYFSWNRVLTCVDKRRFSSLCMCFPPPIHRYVRSRSLSKKRRARSASLRSSPRARLALRTSLAFASVRLKEVKKLRLFSRLQFSFSQIKNPQLTLHKWKITYSPEVIRGTFANRRCADTDTMRVTNVIVCHICT